MFLAFCGTSSSLAHIFTLRTRVEFRFLWNQLIACSCSCAPDSSGVSLSVEPAHRLLIFSRSRPEWSFVFCGTSSSLAHIFSLQTRVEFRFLWNQLIGCSYFHALDTSGVSFSVEPAHRLLIFSRSRPEWSFVFCGTSSSFAHIFTL